MHLSTATLLCIIAIGISPSYAGDRNEVRLPDESHLMRLPDGGDPRTVHASGRIIKWLNYAKEQNGTPEERSFYVACNRTLAAAPFLVHSLQRGTLAVDLDGNGKAALIIEIGPPLDTGDGGEVRTRILYRASNLPIALEELAADILRNRDFDPSAFLEFLPTSRQCRASPVS